eukprot:1602049-Lingulodinium_polyedra.AAC.1
MVAQSLLHGGSTVALWWLYYSPMLLLLLLYDGSMVTLVCLNGCSIVAPAAKPASIGAVTMCIA